MGCCLSTEAQVDLVIAQFAKYYTPFHALKAGEFPQLVAGRMVPVSVPLIAPVTQRRCVYYSVKAEELVHKTAINNGKVEHYTDWEYRYTDTKSSDFLLIDPGNPSVYVYIPFTQTNHKIHSESDGLLHNVQKGAECNESMREMRGRFLFNHQEEWRYTEQCFEVGEEAAVVGVIKDAKEQGGKILHPMSSGMLTERYLSTNNWTAMERSSWIELTQSPCIIVTDCPQFLQGRGIAPLPQAYAPPPSFTQPLYIAGYTPSAVPHQPGPGMVSHSQVYPIATGPQSTGGYPPQLAAGGYPQAGYIPQQGTGGQGGYPPQGVAVYLPQQGTGALAGGYPPQQVGTGYPPQGGGGPGGYPPQQVYPVNGGFPPQQGGNYSQQTADNRPQKVVLPGRSLFR